MRRLLVVALAFGIVWLHGQTARAEPAQPVVEDVAAFLSGVLRVPVEAPPLVVDDHLEEPIRVAERRFLLWDPITGYGGGEIAMRLHLVRELRSIAAGGTGGMDSPAAVRVLAHELAHQGEGPDRATEEGITEAFAQDVAPALMVHVFGPGGASGWGFAYPEEVAAIRATSRFGSGSPCWRARAAVLWRRTFLLADTIERAAMVRAADERRASWPRSRSASRVADPRGSCIVRRATTRGRPSRVAIPRKPDSPPSRRLAAATR